jgi:DNA-binding transcriptional ArsR family regulator
VPEPSSPTVNEVGDVVLSDAPTIEALADPDRFRLFGHVQRHGPVDESALVAALGVADDAVGALLQVLAEAGLVTRSPAGWSAPGRGLYVDAAGGEAEEAARRLYEVMILDTTEMTPRWVHEDAGRLPNDWFLSSGMFNARVTVTREELDDLQVRLEELLTPYLSRDDAPADAKRVRVLAYFMAEPD